MGQTIGRIKGAGAHTHPEPFFFYFLRFPAGFLPWSVLLPAAFVLAFRSQGIERKRLLFLLIWLVVPICFLTLSKGKKDTYLLPFYPAASLMLGALWVSEDQSSGVRKGMMAGSIFLTSAILIVFLLNLSGLLDRFDSRLHDYRSTIIIISSYLFVGSLLSTLFFIQRRRWASLMSGVIVCLFLHLHLSYLLPREFNAERSLRPFSESMLQTMREGDELKTSHFISPGLLFYMKRDYVENIRMRKRFREVMKSPHRVFVVVQKGDWKRVKPKDCSNIHMLDMMKIGIWEVILLSNRPGDAAYQSVDLIQ